MCIRDRYVRQKEKPKLFALFKNPFSKKPVIYDSIQARLTCQDLLTAMQNQGFLHAGVSLYTTVHGEDWANAGTRNEMDGENAKGRKRKKAPKLDATYLLHPGEPFFIGKVEYCLLYTSYTRIKPWKTLQFTIGQERVPFTIDAHRSPHQQYFANRSFIAKQVGNVRDVGAEIGYTWNVGFPIVVNAGIFNGSGLTNQKDYWTKGVNYSAKAQFLFPNVNLVLSCLLYTSFRPTSSRESGRSSIAAMLTRI